MDSTKLERVMNAVEEIATGDMNITVLSDGLFEVKGYQCDPTLPYCECKDHEHNCEFCKHCVAAVLYALWDDDVTIDITGSAVESDGGRTLLDPQYDSIPSTLTAIDSWVVWQEMKGTVVPLNPETGGVVRDPAMTGSFTRAKESDIGDGVAFVVTEADPFTTERYPKAWDDSEQAAVHALDSIVRSPIHYVEVAPNRRDVTAVQIGVGDDASLPIQQRAVPITGVQLTEDDVARYRGRKEVA